jgi:hypothetical protein
LALAFDAMVLARHWHTDGSVIPGDYLEFRQNALATAAHLQADSLPYPPPFLLLTTPFSWLPPAPGYIAWTIAGLACLIIAAKVLGFRPGAMLLGAVSVPALYCVLMGQTGLFISAALLLSLGLVETQPILAGIAAGCLIIKPQFALLLPVCFLALGNKKAFFAAAATVAILCGFPIIFFGLHVWQVFFFRHVGGAQSLLAAPWPALFEYTMVTVFMLCRSLGASLHVASIVQIFSTVMAAALCWRLWRGGGQGQLERMVITLCLIMLATPYAYIYDLPALALALAEYAARQRPYGLGAAALFWFFTGIYPLFSTFLFLPGAAFIAALCLLINFAGRYKAPLQLA